MNNCEGAAWHNQTLTGQIERELTQQLDKLELNAETVVQGILDTIRRADEPAKSPGPEPPSSKGYELLGRHLGMFTDRLEVRVNQNLMAALEEGRKRVAGLIVDSAEEDSAREEARPDEEKAEREPN